MTHFEQGPFVTAANFAAEIDDQHARARQVGATFDDADFQRLALDGLANEQADTMGMIEVAVDDAPFEALGYHSLELEAELAAAHRSLADAQRSIAEQSQRIDEMAEALNSLVPDSEEDTAALAARKKEALRSLEDEARMQIEIVTADIVETDALMTVAGKAWTRPLLVNMSETEVDETELQPIPMQATQPSNERKRTPSWERLFVQNIGEALNVLERDGLLSEDPINTVIIQKNSSSAIMGTKTAIERMVEKGLLPNSALSGQPLEMSAAEIVTMYLQNTHRTIFTTRQRRKRALTIVDECVDKYFENQDATTAK